MAKINKEKLLQISENFIFVNWQGVVEILNLHRKWKNEKMKNIVLFQIRLQRELCFWKCKILLHLRVLEFQPQKKKKKCKQNFIKTLIFLPYLCNLHI